MKRSPVAQAKGPSAAVLSDSGKSHGYLPFLGGFIHCTGLKSIWLYLSSLTLLQAIVVSKQSLESWLARNQTHLPQPNEEEEEEEVPEEISISDIVCKHDALDPSKAGRMKCINEVSADPAAMASKFNRRIRVPTRKYWLPDVRSRRRCIQAIFVQFASHKRTKVRISWPTEWQLGTKFP